MHTKTTNSAAAPGDLTIELAGGMRLNKWCATVGLSRTTAWRLRKSGRLPVVIRYGMPFVTAATIHQFFQDAGKPPTQLLNK